MLVSWTCFRIIHASSCFPFCQRQHHKCHLYIWDNSLSWISTHQSIFPVEKKVKKYIKYHFSFISTLTDVTVFHEMQTLIYVPSLCDCSGWFSSVTSRKKRGLSGMVVRAEMAATEGKAHTNTNTRQLWNWYAEPIWKLQPKRQWKEWRTMDE